MTEPNSPSPRRPNVVLVITDDQGYADLGCTGNPWIRTPNVDAFSKIATRLEDFHVAPLCTPTRGAILSGRYPIRNGAWATCWGRSILRREEVTLADVFRAGGYRTGMFGKWHLGDNYPYRPEDRGFERVVAHKGGGVGQTPDFWGNNYFDDTYFQDGKPTRYDGYCTDVWFDQALDFIESCASPSTGSGQAEPFFCYLATNAPHAPYLVADKYKQPYLGNPDIPEPAFYGMIENIDENFGRLQAKLDEWGLTDDTILIFMTDNGSSGGSTLDEKQYVAKGYNAGMRGKKGSYYDGGHRVPFFIRWPNGNIAGMQDVRELACHVDLMPTFIELCGLKAPEGVELDGLSIAPLLQGKDQDLPDRTVFLQNRQRTVPPGKWESAVATRQWRLIHGEELYDIQADPGQRTDVAAKHPDVVQRLRAEHEKLWTDIEPTLAEYCPIVLGSDEENPTRLNSMDITGDVAWHQNHIRKALKASGGWAVEVERAGRYRFALRRWPEELDLSIYADCGSEDCVLIRPSHARLRIGAIDETITVSPDDKEAIFEVDLPAGRAHLDAEFVSTPGWTQETQSAYYVYVERLTP